MNEIDVTKVSAIEYLRKFVKIKKKETCPDDVNCCDCKYENVSCLNKIDYIHMDIKDHIQRVMGFDLPEPKIDWTKIEKDTLIEVKGNGETQWSRCYFAACIHGKVYAYLGGRTSKTESRIVSWELARLVDEE
jgi:hypothetical protein